MVTTHPARELVCHGVAHLCQVVAVGAVARALKLVADAGTLGYQLRIG
jgi:hypothetical protein